MIPENSEICPLRSTIFKEMYRFHFVCNERNMEIHAHNVEYKFTIINKRTSKKRKEKVVVIKKVYLVVVDDDDVVVLLSLQSRQFKNIERA